MTSHRTVKKIGGSLVVLIPRDVADMMNVTEGSPVSLTLTGRQLVVEPESGFVRDHTETRMPARDCGVEHMPNAKTRAAIREGQRGGLRSAKNVSSLLVGLNADD